MGGKAGNKSEYHRDQAGASKWNDPWVLIIDNDDDDWINQKFWVFLSNGQNKSGLVHLKTLGDRAEVYSVLKRQNLNDIHAQGAWLLQ